MKTNRQLFFISLLLTTPVIIFLLGHYFIHPANLHPTGFTQPDNIAYMSNARQHLEQDSFRLTYSNPFNYTSLSPAIYSQPTNFILCLLLLFSLDPGLVFSIFGLISALFCIYVTLQLINYLYPNLEKRKTIYLLSIWGGGIGALAGLAANSILANGTYTGFDAIFRYDPGEGWWGLNLARPFFIPLEAFYHFLFISCIFLLLKRQWVPVLLLSFVLCWSHPFTGIEYLGIVLGWLFIEKIIIKNQWIPWSFIVSIIILTILHLLYYLVYLNSFPEHKSLFQQFSINWSYNYKFFIPAYILVATLAFLTFYRDKTGNFFKKEHNRLFICWAVIAFLFSKHDWFITPIQPLHFTRGYIWWGLFLLGIPALEHLLKKLPTRGVTMVFILLFLSDNILWYTRIVTERPTQESVGYISQGTKQILGWLHSNTTANDLLISNEELVSTMANAYASSYSWVGHEFNTPFYKEKKEKAALFFEKGTMQPEWHGRRILIVLKRDKVNHLPLSGNHSFSILYENPDYEVYQLASNPITIINEQSQ